MSFDMAISLIGILQEEQIWIDYSIDYVHSIEISVTGMSPSNVRDMEGMFHGAYSFNGDLSNWNCAALATHRSTAECLMIMLY
jgi:hypothetical protein